jgi:hypothetical protein
VAEPPALAQILDSFRDMVSRNSDSAPTAMEYVLTTRRAAHLFFGSSVSAAEGEFAELPAVVAATYGRVIGYTAKGPWPRYGDGKPPSGAMLFAIFDAASGWVMGWGIQKEPIGLAPLGEVCIFRSGK